MKRFLPLLLGFLLIMAHTVAVASSSLDTHRKKTSYAVGVNLMGNLKQQDSAIDVDAVIQGMRDASAGKLVMTEEDIRKYLSRFQSEVRVKQAKARPATAENNRKAEAAFFAENARQKGMVTLPSGLQYKILTTGDGRSVTDTDSVVCNYRGTTLSGTEFDSSYRKGEPSVLKVKGGAIPGLAEALKLMRVGSKWQIFIPARLAYAEHGYGSMVGPDEAVIFELELMAIK